VAGEQQRDELVAQLVVVELADEQREDVVALVEVGRAPALADLLAQDGVRGAPAASATTTASCVGVRVVRSSTSSMRRRSSSSRGPSRVPKTARRMTSRVIERMRGSSANGRWRGQRSTSRSVTASMRSP
jgi:hypothetical protein